jgi:hypothetical protein
MLWWGVMTVTGVGWFLFGQIIVVVLIIGVGGPAILVCHLIPSSESADQSDYITPTNFNRGQCHHRQGANADHVACTTGSPGPAASSAETEE